MSLIFQKQMRQGVLVMERQRDVKGEEKIVGNLKFVSCAVLGGETKTAD